jgi:methylphosphotriester-DNA--protein-cysteine methyltransferase
LHRTKGKRNYNKVTTNFNPNNLISKKMQKTDIDAMHKKLAERPKWKEAVAEIAGVDPHTVHRSFTHQHRMSQAVLDAAEKVLQRRREQMERIKNLVADGDN